MVPSIGGIAVVDFETVWAGMRPETRDGLRADPSQLIDDRMMLRMSRGGLLPDGVLYPAGEGEGWLLTPEFADYVRSH